jgi:Bacteriocin-protection, YdeI or OmpD-Associated
MRSYPYQFRTTIGSIKYGRMFYGGVFLPDTILSALPEARGRGFRLVGEVGGVSSEFGLMAVKTARFIVLPKGFLTQAKLKAGDVVTFRFFPIDPDYLEVPPELEQALQTNRAAAQVWSQLTTGKKREYVHRVASAAHDTTRQKRVGEVIGLLENPPDRS